MTPAKIILVEDDFVVARDIQQQLTRLGHTVVGSTARGEEAIRLAQQTRPDLVLMDIRLAGAIDGIDAARRIRELCLIPVIYLTAYADDQTLRRASITEPFGYILKPFEDSQLRTSIEMALYKHHAEKILRESERRYAVTLSSIGEAVIATDGDLKITFMNSGAETLTGWPQADATGRGLGEVFRLFDEQTRAPAGDPSVTALRTRESAPFPAHALVRSRNARENPVDGTVAPIIDDHGAVTGVVIVFRDVTQRRRAEEAEALREVHARIDRAVRGSNIGVWEVEVPEGDRSRGAMTIANISEQLGYTRPNVPVDLLRALDFIHPDDRAALDAAIRAYLGGTSSRFEIEIRVRHRDESYRWMIVRGVAVRERALLRFVGTTVDITDRKNIEADLRAATNTAEAANRAKDEFLANVSHEIRTPMNAILGMTELALDTAHSDDQRHSLRTVKSSAEGLLAIIDDLLDFSKIEAGKLEIDPAELSVRRVLADTLRTLATRAHRKGLELVYDVQEDVPDLVVGDPDRLRQVLTNLVGNAIKFTEHGEVVIDVSAAPSSNEKLTLRFAVRDTGIGIAPEKQDLVFRAFEQEDTSTTRKYGGTGLGLTIAARLVGLMGGALTVESAPGRGSTFRFDAQVTRSSRTRETATSTAALRDRRVLVVDDNATSRRILEGWLHSWELAPVSVASGAAAMAELLDGVATGRPYALVLLDARMPDGDAMAMATRIREREKLHTTRIVVLSVGEGPDALARYRELRVAAHLLKPLPQQDLLDTIREVLSEPTPAPPRVGSTTSVTPRLAPLRILVAEDHELNAQLLDQLLVRRGHIVHLARDGRQALAHLETGSYDLFLLDLHMPEVDGFEVIDHLRTRERASGGPRLPVIALTARSRAEDRDRCLAAGMDDFLVKPIHADVLFEAIHRLLGPTAADAHAASTLITPSVLLSAAGGDPAILARICSVLVTRVPEDLAAVETAFRDRDAPRLREAAHLLCGLVAAFSTTVSSVASDLEDQAALGDLTRAAPLVEQLRMLVPDLRAQVARISFESLERAATVAARD